MRSYTAYRATCRREASLARLKKLPLHSDAREFLGHWRTIWTSADAEWQLAATTSLQRTTLLDDVTLRFGSQIVQTLRHSVRQRIGESSSGSRHATCTGDHARPRAPGDASADGLQRFDQCDILAAGQMLEAARRPPRGRRWQADIRLAICGCRPWLPSINSLAVSEQARFKAIGSWAPAAFRRLAT